MPGTSNQGKKAAQTLRERMGEKAYSEHMSKLGKKGGVKGTHRPFRDPEQASRAAKIRWAKHKKTS